MTVAVLHTDHVTAEDHDAHGSSLDYGDRR
jgi:hypothetical protein